MKADIRPVPEEMATLANDAALLIVPLQDQDPFYENAAEANKRLAYKLNRLRGEAVFEAKAAMVRMRKFAYVSIAFSFGMGILLGLTLCPRGTHRTGKGLKA